MLSPAQMALSLLTIIALELPTAGQQQSPPPESIPTIEKDVQAHSDGQPFRFEAVYILDALSNLKGGVRRKGETLGNLNMVFDYRTPWDGSFQLFLQGLHGGSISEHAGDFQALDHIEAPAPTLNFLEAHYRQDLLDDRLSLLFGLYAVDSEFDTRDSASLFVHSSPGTGGDLGQVGRNGPGIFPFGALGGRLRYQQDGWYGQAAVVEGVPGDPERPYGNTLRWDRDEGLFVIGEAGHIWEDENGQLGKACLGVWGFTAPYETHLDPLTANASNRGGYLSLEKVLSREEGDPQQGLTAYLRLGLADGRINPIETFVGAGAVYTGVFPGRDRDRLGLAINTGFSGQDYLRSGAFERHETALELTYSFALSENFSIQPDLQYIINPGFDPALQDSLVLGLGGVFAVSN